MVNCGRCKKCFRDNYTLVRHQSRKNLCGEVFGENDNINPNIQSLNPNIQSLNPNIQSFHNCVFCLNKFSTTWYKNKHEKMNLSKCVS